VQLGVVPEASSSYLLPAIVGFQRAAEILFSSRWIPADEAVAMGLGVQVLAHEQMLPVVMAQAKQIAKQSKHSLRTTKMLIRAARNEAILAAQQREHDAFRKTLGSKDNQAAIQAFFAGKKSK
jgi:enoyl-CoA hydratase/carnithine racemase